MVQQLSRTQPTQLDDPCGNCEADRGNGRVSLSRTVYTVPSGQVIFNHDGNKGSTFYCCTLHKHSGARQLLGAIERNPRTECWQVSRLCRAPYFDGIPHLGYREAVDFLMSQRLA